MPAIYEPLAHPEHEHREYPMQVVHGVSFEGVQLYPGVIVNNKEEHDAWIADKAGKKKAEEEKTKAEAIVAEKLSSK